MGRTGVLAMAVAILGLGAVAPAGAASLPAGTTAILSGTPSLLDSHPVLVGSSRATAWSVSQGGRYVAFASTSDGLVDGDDDTTSNVYVKDRATGAVTLASRRTGMAGEPSHSYCHEPAISDDGTRVAFSCDGPLDPADTNAEEDVYVRDLTAGATLLVSRGTGLGPVGDGRSGDPVLSQTGEYVAFTSEATNLTQPATQSSDHVFRRRIGGGDPVIAVSVPDGSGEPGGDQPSISDDGNRIAFRSFLALTPVDDNSAADVYVRDVAAATTLLASREAGAGDVGDGDSESPAIAGDGQSVAFSSRATQFDNASDPDTGEDVYWRQLGGAVGTQNTALVSINAGGDKGQNSYSPAIDDTGAVVAFTSHATALHPDDTDPMADGYVKNLTTNALEVVTRADGTAGAVANVGTSEVAVSGDGTKVVASTWYGFTPDADPATDSVVLRDLAATPRRTFTISRPPGSAPFVNEGGFADGPVLSDDGRYAVFSTSARALGSRPVRSSAWSSATG